MTLFGKLLFGRVDFAESEEYLEFQYRFLIVVLVSGAVFTALFLLADLSSVNPLQSPHIYSMRGFTFAALLLWLMLRGRKHRFYLVAWSYEALCVLEYVSALILVPGDELRVLWFFSNIPGVYILLGQRAGFVVSTLTVVGLALGNRYLSAPYSPNALATCLISMIYLAMFFHVYGSRSISYFVRMHESNRKLHRMATHDMLTGVLNARAYYELCNKLIGAAQRSGAPCCVLFIDLDHFKAINDTYGHAAGDSVLRSVADCLAKNIRHSDALGRIGGEEFSIFLPNTDVAGAAHVAETIRTAIEASMPQIDERRIKVTASIGIARNRHSEQTMLEIQQQADQAMYVAKSQGRNRVSSFESILAAG